MSPSLVLLLPSGCQLASLPLAVSTPLSKSRLPTTVGLLSGAAPTLLSSFRSSTLGRRLHHPFSPLNISRFAGARNSPRAAGDRVRSEQRAAGSNGPGAWLGRGAMLGFTAAIAVELTTGQGVLENLGLRAPLPTLALGLTAVVGVVAAFFIFQSASED